jgi:hypothetical protein
MKYREIHRIADRYLLTHDPHCMAGCMGLDNRSILPPFMPCGRNQDGVFGAMLASSDPEALFSHIPYGIIHDAERAAAYEGPANRSASETRMSELVISLLQRAAPSDLPANPAHRMRRIATSFRELGEVSPQEFRTYTTRVLLDVRCHQLAKIESLVSNRSTYPDYWKADLCAYRQVLLSNLRRPEFFLPIESHSSVSIHDGFGNAQQFVHAFGRLLHVWPTLWSNFKSSDVIRHEAAASVG